MQEMTVTNYFSYFVIFIKDNLMNFKQFLLNKTPTGSGPYRYPHTWSPSKLGGAYLESSSPENGPARWLKANR